ncbi:MAG: TonB-dependent receptor [Gammaproteobacteria bacterium]|jgi:outer membrane receptor protein involved in Fe transport|nr:TonB-dependent receptor [Gammaproteobacteria bacterium]MDP6732415.1 TonB-dependent receptor [Gammaproteobacteria bacterium]
MRKKFPLQRKTITIGVILAGLSLPVAAQQDDDTDVEEVIVTGSFIRGSPLDAPSPVNVIDRDSIEAQGASAIWDVIRNLEVNQGSDTSIAGSNDAGQLSGTASVNLRNLGGNSTLTLINGKRFTPAAVVSSSGQEYVDLNAIPVVMTDRIEVLTDGGSALYGSDAVAGVVNVIMRTDFEGVELYADTQGIDEEGGTYEETFSGIWGTSFNDGDTRLVLSGEYFERDAVQLEDASYYDPERIVSNGRVGSFGISTVFGGGFNPAYINVPLTTQNRIERAGLGESISGTRGIVWSDPLCETLSTAKGDLFIDNRFTGIGRRSGTCVENTIDEQFIAIGQERSSFAGTFEHTFSESAEFYSFYQYSDVETTREGSGYAFSRTLHGIPAPGLLGALSTFVGNPYVASPAANNPHLTSNGGFGEGFLTPGNTISTGWPRSGEDRITDNETLGVQLGLRGDFQWRDRSMTYDVSYSLSQSSIEQEYETLIRDRTEMALYGLGGENCTPNGSTDVNFLAVPGFGALSGIFDIVFPNYILNTREGWSQALTSTNHGQGGCEWYNPYLTSLTDPNQANSQELIDWITAENLLRADKRNELEVFDAVVTGELFEMTGGTAQFAAGYQRRERKADGRAPDLHFPGLTVITDYASPSPFAPPSEYATEITNNLECANCIFTFSDERDIDAVFFELSLPFAENVETQIAVRWEDYGGNIGDDVSPKFAISWRPIDDLLLRASFSESFRAPNIGVVNQAFEAFGTTLLDPLRNQDVRAGLLPATNENAQNNFSFTVGQPNPFLDPEDADTFNVGFQWTPSGDFLDGLSIGADVWRFEVEGRVLPQIPRASLDPEIEMFNSIVGFDGSDGGRNVYILNDSLPIDARDPVTGNPISCDPNALAAQFGIGSSERRNCVVSPLEYRIYNADGSQSVQRNLNDTNGGLITLALPAVNAGNIDVQGIDVKAGYSWENDWGQWRIGLDFVHIDEYKVEDVPGLELGLQETGKTDAAGTDGEQNIVREVPDNKGTISLSWNRGNHRVSVFNRHIGSYQILGHRAYIAEDQRTDLDLAYARSEVSSYNTWDIQYGYTHQWANDALGTTRVTVGVIDATDARLPLFRRSSFDPSVFDGRGRQWYARALWQF